MIAGIIAYFIGIVVGMLAMSALLKSRILYHLNTFDWLDTTLKYLKIRVDLDLALIPQDVWSH